MQVIRAVSTHSRPKAAAWRREQALIPMLFQLTAARRRLLPSIRVPTQRRCFNSQPPEGGCVISAALMRISHQFQLTAARRRLHSVIVEDDPARPVSTHSRSKAAAFQRRVIRLPLSCFNSQPLEGGCPWPMRRASRGCRFQLTAARRRLLFLSPS